MCLVALAFRYHPDYPLVVVANRDEFYDRPAEGARFWDDHPHVLAGRDMEAGGTWFGVNRHGDWATVTNYRGGGMGGDMRSRGDLPTDFLSHQTNDLSQNRPSPEHYANGIVDQAHHFRGFSLLAGNLNELVYCSNANPGSKGALQTLKPGIYTLSNDVLDTPWPKAEYARDMLTATLDQAGELDIETLLAILGSREVFPDDQLPHSEFGLEMERTLSPPFIVSDSYGTRCTTLLMIDTEGRVTFTEQSYYRGQATKRQDYAFEVLNTQS